MLFTILFKAKLGITNGEKFICYMCYETHDTAEVSTYVTQLVRACVTSFAIYSSLEVKNIIYHPFFVTNSILYLLYSHTLQITHTHSHTKTHTSSLFLLSLIGSTSSAMWLQRRYKISPRTVPAKMVRALILCLTFLLLSITCVARDNAYCLSTLWFHFLHAMLMRYLVLIRVLFLYTIQHNTIQQ
jgi:hypothetical protein